MYDKALRARADNQSRRKRPAVELMNGFRARVPALPKEGGLHRSCLKQFPFENESLRRIVEEIAVQSPGAQGAGLGRVIGAAPRPS